MIQDHSETPHMPLTPEQQAHQKEKWPHGAPNECIGKCAFCSFQIFWCKACGWSEEMYDDGGD